MDLLTFLAICVIFVPWQILAFIVLMRSNHHADTPVNMIAVLKKDTMQVWNMVLGYVTTQITQYSNDNVPNSTKSETIITTPIPVAIAPRYKSSCHTPLKLKRI